MIDMLEWRPTQRPELGHWANQLFCVILICAYSHFMEFSSTSNKYLYIIESGNSRYEKTVDTFEYRPVVSLGWRLVRQLFVN